MKLFEKKIPAERIGLLREAIKSRKQLESYVKEAKKIWFDEETDSGEKISRSVAEYDIPMIDLLRRLKDNEFLRLYEKKFIPHVREYINLLNQEEYSKAIELNRQYFQE